MNSTLRKFAQAGFTLVELLIVVIILAILAAIVIPQFSSSTKDAQESALDANLAALRSAVELFKVQHNNVYPSAVASSGGCSGTTGTGDANSAQAWVDHLLLASNAAGATCGVSDAATYRFGPYVRKGIPADPIFSKGAAVIGVAVPATGSGIVITSTGTPIVASTTAGTGGWAFDNKSGQIIMNNNNSTDLDAKGKAYSTH